MQTTNETVTYINGITFHSVYTITYSITFLENTLCISLLLPSIGSLPDLWVCQILLKLYSYVRDYDESAAYS
jgi:hypothetical protein